MARGNCATLVVVAEKLCLVERVAWAGTRRKNKVVRHSESLSVMTANRFVWLVFETAVDRVFPRVVKKIAPLLVFVPSVRRRCSTSPNWWFGDVFESQPESLPSKIRSWNEGRPTTGWPECASIVPVSQQSIKTILEVKHGQGVA